MKGVCITAVQLYFFLYFCLNKIQIIYLYYILIPPLYLGFFFGLSESILCLSLPVFDRGYTNKLVNLVMLYELTEGHHIILPQLFLSI